MDRNITKKLFFLCYVLLMLTGLQTVAQTINVGAVDAGPYGRGSSIGVPFRINSSSGCIGSTNTFTLYLSDASGNFGAQTNIGSFVGFYGSFLNGVIPSGAVPGTGYRVRVGTSSPAAFSAPSAPFTIGALPGVTAATTSQFVNAANPNVFGSCLGVENAQYNFSNQSSTGATATINFYNELLQADEGTLPLGTSTDFVAKTANYTVLVKAIGTGGVVGTQAYLLLNNVVNNSFGASGSTTVCLGGQNTLTYNVDISSNNGIQRNYPGLTYRISWGDGASSVLTLCDIVNAGGKISHPYIRSSCGNMVNGQVNVFEVDLQPVSPYCGNVVTKVTGYAKVLAPPDNRLTNRITGCINTPILFENLSTAGQDPNATTADCTNMNALYTWLVDGVVVATNLTINQDLTHTFTTPGMHTITLRLQNNNGVCTAPDGVQTICIQRPPTPAFTLPVTTICSANTLTPVNTSFVDNTCNNSNTFNWVVTGPSPVAYSGGTNGNSAQPNFLFNSPGIYTIRLDVTTASCGVFSSAEQTVTVNSSPVANLSPNANICGRNITLNFNANPGVTQSIITGTLTQLPTTYVWAVTGGAFSYTGGTNANSRYPQILFNDFATYTITVSHTNNCGTATDTQVLTFQQAPVVNAGADQTICEGSQAALAGSITGGTANSFTWVGGTGTFLPSRNVLNPTYTPSAAEIAAGQAIVSLQAQTSVAPPCDVITDDVVITITQKDDITSTATQSVCTRQQFTYTITSANPASTYSWVTTLVSGTATGFGATGSGNTINDVIDNSSATTDAVIRYTITPATNGCPGNPFQLTLTVKPLPVLTATSSTPVICSNQPTGITFTSNIAGTTFLWTSTASAGVTGNTSPTTPAAAGNITDVLVNNGTTDGTVTYNIIPYNGNCVGIQTTITITVKPTPVVSVPGPDDEICASSTYTLKGNSPAPGTGKWTVASGQSGITFSDDTNPNATVNGLQPGNVYQFRWTITASPTCPSNSNVVTITVDAATVGGTTAGASTVCAGSNTGQVTLSGQVGTILRWESSVDNGVTWVALANVTATQTYNNLTQTTQYRAVVQNKICSIQNSSVTTITVNTPVVAANAGADVKICNTASIFLDGNQPAPFAGVWSQVAGPPVTFVNAADPKTQVNGLIGGNIYRFVWTIKGLPPCDDSNDEVIIENTADVIASFTADKSAGCGPLNVTFTNTSTLIAGTNFLWNFGDGTPVSNEVNPQHVFQPGTDGKDIVYTVSLSIPNNCVARPPVTFNITVRPATPVVRIVPDRQSGCGAVVLTVQNASPGNNALYEFYLYDGGTLIQKITKTDRSDAVFNPVSTPVTKTYNLYLEATDLCGTKVRSNEIPITISPAQFVSQMFVANNVTKGCAPFSTTFINNASGGDNFAYKIYDANNALLETLTASRADFPYTFANAGVYFISLTASNDCASLESSPKIRIEVAAKLQPDFDADVKTGCGKVSINFANLTTANGGTPAASLSYDWDFGDGSAHSSSFNPPTHIYDFKKSPYTVRLTVTNLATGCSNVITKTNFVVVDSPPGTGFTAKPGFTTEIPNYTFSFEDKTTGSNLQSWRWTFGDGSSSTSRNPNHTYADTGKYVVTLTVSNLACDSTITHEVKITGVPGQLYLPNAFMPGGSTTELKTFMAKGSGIASWRLQVFNNWGQLVWETSKLSSTGEPVEGWDGTFKGVPAPQGVYIWQATARFINGTDWKGMSYNKSLPKRTGAINLIR